ncbi:hypothetical protein HYH02_006588 [Chlamydomonas schloesseri]|uniref:C2 domain-containing protein n=1 Tax=Chlamydomonas schloesseri TaxID=2026947 RepID=A0A835W804_9CHLO|nr:hypothetical protein HYH02_006588 [Chlamydomonas schloesseri]|eukprot:KAG2439061.1 hypothetical protein HYH02_006588 [Chlamydomonas schloesseri]
MITAAGFAPGVLTVTVAFAQNLKDKQLFGRQDPYCVLRVGGQTARTRTASKGGRNPTWNESFSFNVYRHSGLEITVKDDRVFVDPTLGVASVSLDGVRANGYDKLVTDVVSPSSRRHQGVISLSLQWKDGCPPEPEAPPKAPFMQPPRRCVMAVGMHHHMHMANCHAHHMAAHNRAMMHHHMHMHGHMHGHHHHHHGHCH